MANVENAVPTAPAAAAGSAKAKPKKSFSYPDRDDFKSGYETSLTSQQAEALREFKIQLKDTEFWPDLQQNPDGDRFLLRFLRATMKDKNGARTFQIKAAVERIITTLKFRRQHHADEIRQSIERNEPLSEDYIRYRDKVRPRIQFIDRKSGRLVHMERFGVLGSSLDTKQFETDKWIEFFVRDCEMTMFKLREESKRRGYEVATQISVMDQSHGGMGIVKRMSLLKVMNAVAAENYPELLGPIVLVNCPWIFTTVFGIIRPMIDPDTASKLIVEYGIPRDLLADFLCVEDLPKEYGGQADVVLGYCCDFKQ